MKLNEKFNVSPSKVKALLKKIQELKINTEDIEETISRGGGKGGQKINKTSNKVMLFHRPTGARVVCQRERQRNLNRFFALRELVDRIEVKLTPKPVRSYKLNRRQKIRKNKKRMQRRRFNKNLDYDD